MSTTIAASPYKYNIKARLYAVTEDVRKRVQAEVMEKTEISRRQYSRYINLLKTESADIPSGVLREFALQLHCTTDDLFNS